MHSKMSASLNKQSGLKILISLLLISLVACGEPMLYFAGGRLAGEEAPLINLPSSEGVFQIETAPADPYSVNIGYFLLDSTIYIDPAEDRQWYQNILINPAVRIRFEGSDQVHPMMTVRESDPEILARFDPERIVLRLEPLQ